MPGTGGFALAGGVLLLLGLLGSIWIAHLRSLRYFDRPGLARRRGFDAIASITRWLCLAAGLVLVGRASGRSAAALCVVLVLIWAYRGLIRSLRFQAWLMKRDYRALRSERPGVPERDLLRALLLRRNPGWGEELIEQMVLDDPDIESLARMVAKMERGFRGFR